MDTSPEAWKFRIHLLRHAAGHAREDLTLAGFRMHSPDACLGETPDDFGKLRASAAASRSASRWVASIVAAAPEALATRVSAALVPDWYAEATARG